MTEGAVAGSAPQPPLPDDMWTPYKHLHRLIGAHLHGHIAETTGLEAALRTHRQVLVNVLATAPKNAARRAEIVRGIDDGIQLPGLGHTTLSRDLVDETLIISDMYDLNEYVALELLCTAHQQMPNHPGLNRGLVAVLLYYDGRKTLATALRDLFQASEGVSWCSDAPPAVTAVVTSFTAGLVADGLLGRVLDQLERLDVTRELALLGENRALGRPKHHRQVLDLFEDVRAQLAGVLFCRAAQQGLPAEVTVRLCRYLARYRPSGARGGMDNVALTLVMALLYALDLSVLQRHEDSEQLVRRLPIVAEAGFAQTVWDALCEGGGGVGSWECEELRALVYYAFGLAMAALRQAPQVLQTNAARIIDQDEALVEAAIQGKVFEFLYHVVLENEMVFKVEFYYRRIHILITDFIELMHSKVTELRARADETARTIQCHQQQGIEPPSNLCQDFETLLLIVGRFYANDRLGLHLDLEYWKPMEGGGGGGGATSNNGNSVVSTRSVSLFKFIRLAGDLLPATLLVPYLKMLAGLSSCRASAQRTFDFLKQGYGVSGSTTLSWEHFFGSLAKYYANLRQEQHPTIDTVYNRPHSLGRHSIGGAALAGGGGVGGGVIVAPSTGRNINPHEIAGLQAVLAVIRAVAAHDEFARIALCDHPNWQPLVVLLGLVGCAVPIALKRELLLTLAALAGSKETALQLWANLEHSQIVRTLVPTTMGVAASFGGGGGGAATGIENDLRQIEARNETYPLTLALLDFLHALYVTAVPRNLGAGTRRPGLEPYVRFVVDSVFLRFYNLNYKDAAEKWQVAEKCLRLLARFVEGYEVRPGHFPQGIGGGMVGGGDSFGASRSVDQSLAMSMQQQQPQQEENVPAGFHVMLQMHTNDKSEVLRLILHILDEACVHLDTYTQFPGRSALERAARHALRIVELTLAQQDLFFDAHFAANCSVLLAGLNKLLLGVNPRSGRPDHMLNVVKYVTYSVWLPHHALAAVRILTMVARQPQVSGLLLGEFTRSAALANEIRHGFVECLEADADGADKCNDDGGGDGTNAVDDADNNNDDGDGDYSDNIATSTKEAILLLLDDCLPQPSPNVAHYLLGFDITKDIRATRLQQPGVMEFPSNCIRSLITLLDDGIERVRSGQPRADYATGRLLERGYRLLYALCYNQKTADVVLRFLRSCQDFLCRHLAALPLLLEERERWQRLPEGRQRNGRSAASESNHNINNSSGMDCVRLGQMTGLLRCVAIELKITAQNNQVTQFGHLCKILLGMKQSQQQMSAAVDNGMDAESVYANRTFGGDATMSGGNATLSAQRPSASAGCSSLLVIQLLNALDFDVQPVDRPKLDFFDGSLLTQLLQSCEVQPPSEASASSSSSATPRLVNIKRLDEVLRGELAVVQATIASGQMALIMREKDAVLRYALALNAQKSRYVATVRFMEAWTQCTEMVFTVAPPFALGPEAKQTLIVECLQAVLSKVMAMDTLPELANLASGTVLQLLVNLRHTHAVQRQQKRLDGGGGGGDANVSQSAATTAAVSTKNQNSLSLKYILKNMVEWMLLSGAGSQRLKSNLYAALLNFMHIVKGGSGARRSTDTVGSNYVSRLDKSVALRADGNADADDYGAVDHQTQMAVEVFAACGDQLVDVLCQDCTGGGHDVCRMLALACLDMLFDMDPMVGFVQFIARRGYLTHIVDGLRKTDGELCRMMDPVPESMRALYVYESKLAMLGRVAGSHLGAALLLEHKALGVLSQMRCFDMHPDFQLSGGGGAMVAGGAGGGGGLQLSGSFIPAVEQRYQQLLFPALSLCDIVLSTLGAENRSAIGQVVYFLLSHGDMIEMVLRAGTPFLAVGLLDELAAITGLIARTANQEYGGALADQHGSSAELQDLGAHLYRLQKLMLGLWPRFIMSVGTVRDVGKQSDVMGAATATTSAAAAADRAERMVACWRVASNLALYARNAIANHVADHRTVAVLFAPGGLGEIGGGGQQQQQAVKRSNGYYGGAAATSVGTLDAAPSIGLVVAQLKSTVEYWTRERLAYDGLLLQRGSLPKLSLDAKNETQFEQLTEKLTVKQTELRLCVFLVEHCLYLLWAHLDYFMLHALPMQPNSSGYGGHSFSHSTTVDSAWRVTTDDVAQLKKTLNQVLNETFCKQLLATAGQNQEPHQQLQQPPSGVDRDFVAALLRRIKRLIQFAPGSVQ